MPPPLCPSRRHLANCALQLRLNRNTFTHLGVSVGRGVMQHLCPFLVLVVHRHLLQARAELLTEHQIVEIPERLMFSPDDTPFLLHVPQFLLPKDSVQLRDPAG